MYAVIIGGQRCASTWLYQALCRHPEIEAGNPVGREPRATALSNPSDHVLLQKSTRWLTERGRADTLEHIHPEARVIMIGRDMVDRSWSHYRYSRAEGEETLDYKHALSVEAARLQSLSTEQSHKFAYASHSAYPVHLRNGGWIDNFGNQLLLEETSRLDGQEYLVLFEICEFLGLDPTPLQREAAPGLVNEGEPMNELVTGDVMECQEWMGWSLEEVEAQWQGMLQANRMLRGVDFDVSTKKGPDARGHLSQ